MKCRKCNKENREQANFCRFCGAPIERQDDEYAGFYGKKNIREELDKFKKRMVAAIQLKNMASAAKVSLNCVIVGDAGSGRTYLAKSLQGMLLKAGLIKLDKCKEVDAADFSDWMDNFDENLSAVKGGVLLITNAQKLLPEGASMDVYELDRLFTRMRNDKGQMPLVFLSGLKQGLSTFLEANPDIASLFECRYDLKPLDRDDLCIVCEDYIEKSFKMKVSVPAHDKLMKRFEWMVRNEAVQGGGHDAEKIAQDAGVEALMRGASVIEESDIKGPVYEPRTEEEIWAELDGYIGLQNVKKAMHDIVNKIKDASASGNKAVIDDHYVFTGNPGTGKTTMARCFSDILGAIGVLPKGQFIEMAGKDLIADIVGGSERNVKDAVDRAMGGVLFIDEAYGLNSGEFGKSAIDTLVPLLENNRGKFICIIAGYTDNMNDFLKANPGLKSRFNKTIDFPDYNPDEMEQIFLMMAKKQDFKLDDEAKERLHGEMEFMYNRRSSDFGNARDVRNFLKLADERRLERQSAMDSNARAAEGKQLTYHDLAGKNSDEQLDLESIMKELDSLVGLEGVKQNIRALAASVRRDQKLAKARGTAPKIIAEHYLFLGNPGTGKTTVARLMGKMLYALGVIQKPDVREVGREDLVSPYVGDTAPKTKDVVMKAMGGILFIDEAYSLINGDHDQYGNECVNTLVPLLENNRGKFVCIAAGYTREMKAFLDANSGMRSRFTRKIEFEDYNADELYEIFLRNCKSKNLILGEGAADAVRARLKDMYDNRPWDFGNAREVRTYLENVEARLSQRTMYLDDPTEEELTTIKVEDL